MQFTHREQKADFFPGVMLFSFLHLPAQAWGQEAYGPIIFSPTLGEDSTSIGSKLSR